MNVMHLFAEHGMEYRPVEVIKMKKEFLPYWEIIQLENDVIATSTGPECAADDCLKCYCGSVTCEAAWVCSGFMCIINRCPTDSDF